MTNHNPIISIQNMSFARLQQAVFENLNVTIETGKVTAIMGPSGCGKTTLLRLCGGQLKPNAGQINLFGEDLTTASRKRLTKLRGRMGVLFQSGALFTDLNVFDNVAFPMRERKQYNESAIHERVLAKLESVGLRGARHLMPSELSGGMARRVALARAIVNEPELIFYDEPFAGQDPISTAVLQRLIRQLNTDMKLTSVLVSHEVEQVCDVADKIILLGRGKLLAHGTPEEVMSSDNPMVKQFMHGQIDGAIPFHYPEPSAGLGKKNEV